jgi:glycosyltransferase involved in cell wall biosynthesis
LDISVALCTYNGAPHLAEQLASLANQTVQPAELVICDDGSRDQTVEIAKQFTAFAPFVVKLFRNETNLGVANNFAHATRNCSGEFVAYCDQDDVWLPHKLERLTQALRDRPNAIVAFSDAQRVTHELQPMPGTLWETLPMPRSVSRSGPLFPHLLKRSLVTGATMLVNREAAMRLLPPGEFWLHDEWLALFAAAAGQIVAVAEPLIQYRQHQRQQVGSRRLNLWDQFQIARQQAPTMARVYCTRWNAVLKALEANAHLNWPDSAIASLQACLAHWQRRADAINQGRLATARTAIVELLSGRYDRYALGWKSALADLVLS